MKRSARILVGAAAGLLLLLAAIVVAATLIPEERVARAAAARAEDVLGERVRIGTASVRLFPLPGVRLTRIAVGDDDSTALALVDAAELRARILPLFRGQVVVTRLALDHPRILIEIDSAGRPNLPLLAGDSAADTAATPARARDIAFRIDDIAIDGGRIGYRDLRDGTVVRLDGWSQRLSLSGALREGRVATIALTGTLGFDDIDGRIPDLVLPPRDLRLAVEHDATLDLDTDRLELRQLRLSLNGLTLTGTGTVDDIGTPTRRADLRLTGDGIDARELLALAPDSLRPELALPDGTPLELDGRASVEARVQGPLTADSLPRIDGQLSLDQVALTADGEGLVRDVSGTGAFSLDSVVARIRGEALGERFQLGVALRDPATRTLVVALSGKARLDELSRLGLVADTLGLRGALNADLRGQVALENPGAARATGTLELSGIRLDSDPAVHVPFATVRFEPDVVTVRPLRVELGDQRTPLTVELTARGLLPALLDSTAAPPSIAAVVEADTLDLDALLGPSESPYPPLLFARLRDRPIDGRSAAELAEEAGLALPALPPVDATIDASANLLVRNGLRYSDVEAVLRIRPDAIELERARFGLMGGIVELAGRLDGAGGADADGTGRRLAARYSLSGVGAEPFFDRLTPFRDHLTGDLDLVGQLSMVLDQHALPERPAVSADGTMAIAGGRLANWAVLDAVMGRLGVAGRDTVRFRDWAGRFLVNGPLITLEETVLRGNDLDARAAGSIDLGGTLDLGATLYLSTELARSAGAVGQQVIAAAATDGRVPVGLAIAGPVERPSVSLDLSQAREAAMSRAQEAARAEAREAADRVAREVAEEVAERFELPDSLRGLPADSLRAVLGDSLFGLLPDSLTLPGDSIAAKAEEALRQRLRKLWPGGGG